MEKSVRESELERQIRREQQKEAEARRRRVYLEEKLIAEQEKRAPETHAQIREQLGNIIADHLSGVQVIQIRQALRESTGPLGGISYKIKVNVFDKDNNAHVAMINVYCDERTNTPQAGDFPRDQEFPHTFDEGY
jgi:hypothetical protein